MIPDSTKRWIEYFTANGNHLLPIRWNQPETLSDSEWKNIADSIAVFQLGENSEGKSLIALTKRFALRHGDPDLEKAMTMFIREEQRHAGLLGRFMKLWKIPPAETHWSDHVFRHLRHLWNLELSMAVLLTAELVARVYYHALYRATGSLVLRQICRQLLSDEVFHVYFHTQLLRKIRRQRWPIFHSLWNHLYRFFHAGTLLVVWAGHSGVFKRGGFSFTKFWTASRNYCEQAIDLLEPASSNATQVVTRRDLCGIRPS